MQYKSKLIVLRGNSGSGKTTTAKKLREISSRRIALVEQDNIRRNILKEKEVVDGHNIALIEQIVEFALGRDYDVILEGILKSYRYGEMIQRLCKKCPENYIYYFEISFEETLKRHTSRPHAHEFGEKEMRQWYKDYDVLGLEGEKIIPEHLSFDQVVERIAKETGL